MIVPGRVEEALRNSGREETFSDYVRLGVYAFLLLFHYVKAFPPKQTIGHQEDVCTKYY
jgi:hypothetical protein